MHDTHLQSSRHSISFEIKTTTVSISGMSTGTPDSSSQVRVQLSTRHPDISLPENPGPILVNTSNVILELLCPVPTDRLARPAAICPFNTRQYFIAVGKAYTIRVPHQWHISSNISRRVSYSEWHICRNHSCRRICSCDYTATLSCLVRARRLD